MAVVHIIYGKYYDFETGKPTVGGIQTYISALRPIIKECGMNCKIYQRADVDNFVELDDATIIDVPVSPKLKGLKYVNVIVNNIMKKFDDNGDILLFATDIAIVPNKASRSIAIQHGIFWDMPVHENFSPFMNEIYIFSKARLARRIISNLRKVKQVVCVDHNFPNWLRATCAYQGTPLHVIPNFTAIADKNEKPQDKINIIFARRFEKYRGTRVFADAVSKILAEHENVYVTLAGTGPDKKYMEDKLQKFGKRVEFITYKSGESLAVHADKHIAVVPTVGSEGTSLSLLEAMSAQCAVICTDVGGMSNIVLDGYNGLFSDRNAEDLYRCMKELVTDTEKREKIAQKGYETVKEAFSQEVWSEKWKRIFTSLQK